MNLAIIIGVSHYEGGILPLPACRNDARAVSAVLKCDSKFGDVLLLDSDTTAARVKQQLIDFVGRHKSSPVDEILFYFSGHGDFTGDNFYYLLSDYEPRRRKQTTLENSEVDNLLRSLSPRLAVKIIDACASGMSYIKDPESFETYLKGTQSAFKNCYFMFSSQSGQPSFADSDISFFTRGLVEAVLTHSTTSVRYKDLIDYLSDAFEGNARQKPFFVVQADFTERFCTVSDALRAAIQGVLAMHDGSAAQAAPEPQKANDLLSRVRAEAAGYCSEEEAVGAVREFTRLLTEAKPSGEAEGLYELVSDEQESTDSLPEQSAIGWWLARNTHSLFARPLLSKRRLPPPVGEKEECHGYMTTIKMPYGYLRLLGEPCFPNLPPGVCFVVPLLSQTHMRVFWSPVPLRRTNWHERVWAAPVEWATEEVPLRDAKAISDLASKILTGFWHALVGPVRERLLLGTSSPAQGPQ